MKLRFEIGTEIAPFFDLALDAICTPPGKLLALILDQNRLDFGALAWSAIYAEIEAAL